MHTSEFTMGQLENNSCQQELCVCACLYPYKHANTFDGE